MLLRMSWLDVAWVHFYFAVEVSAESCLVCAQVRFRTALLVQAACVLMAVSNAAVLCSTCCATFMGPTFCLVKAVATQVIHLT